MDSTYQVFICHSSEDNQAATELCNLIESKGFKCWISSRDVHAGNYPTQIVNAIKICPFFLIVASNNINSSGHISNEVSIAFDKKKVIVPFLIEKMTFSDELLYFLNRKQWIDFKGSHDERIQKLEDILKENLESHKDVSLKKIEDISWKKIKDIATKNIESYIWKQSEEQKKCASKMFSLMVDSYENYCDEPENLINALSSLVYDCSNKYTLNICGEPGSGKEDILQHLFIEFEKQCEITPNNHIIPFFYDLRYYEQVASDEDIENGIRNWMEKDTATLKQFIKENPTFTPVIFISGLRKYDCCSISTDWILYDLICEIPNYRLVIATNDDENIIKSREKKASKFQSNRYEYNLKVDAINVIDDDAIDEFTRCYNCVYEIEIDETVSKLKKLGFRSLDIFTLYAFHPYLVNDSFDSMASLYETYCIEMLNGISSKLLMAANNAYNLKYSTIRYNASEVFQNIEWTLPFMHNSIMNFLIAVHFIELVRNFKINSDDDFSFLECVFPKTVNTFSTQIMNEDPDTECKMLELSEKYYPALTTLGKTLMTYWLGRMKEDSLSENGCKLLESYRIQILDEISLKEKSTSYTYNEKKSDLFLLRGIDVSLMHKDYIDVGNEYILSLIYNKIANVVNRGYHLEYYGDKHQLPNKKNIDFEDDLKVGDTTLKYLLNSIKKKIDARNYNSIVLTLDLFTASSLLQARFENKIYCKRFSKYYQIITLLIDQYLKNAPEYIDDTIISYFKMIIDHLSSYIDGMYINPKIKLYSTLHNIENVKRTGWVDMNINDPENVMEHTYDSWLLASTFLPDYSTDPDYDKNRIKSMLLIHDIGESITGDVIVPIKLSDPIYDINENEMMKKIFLSGTFPSIPSLMDQYQIWTEWYEQKTFNSKIARDIDVIQAIVQFCRYYHMKPDKFTDDDIDMWISQKNRLKTDIGLKIYDEIVLVLAPDTKKPTKNQDIIQYERI